jgi:Glycosyltransferase 61
MQHNGSSITLKQIHGFHQQHKYVEARALIQEQSVSGQIHWLKEIQTTPDNPPLNVSVLDNIYVVGRNALLLTQSGHILRESVVYSHIEQAIDALEIDEISEKNVFRMCGEFLPLCGCWSEGFWHWMMEYVPIILHAQMAGFNGYYMISPYAPQFVLDTILLLGINPKQVVLYDGTPWLVEKIYLPQRLPASEGLFHYPGSIKLLREAFLNAPGITDKAIKKNTYISRADATKGRKIVNEEQLIELLKKYNFHIICMSNLSIREQINLAANTNILIGPHGAGMAHCVFMPLRSTVIELFSPQYIVPCMLPVAAYLKQSYHMVLPRFVGNEYQYGENIEANLALVETILSAILGHS